MHAVPRRATAWSSAVLRVCSTFTPPISAGLTWTEVGGSNTWGVVHYSTAAHALDVPQGGVHRVKAYHGGCKIRLQELLSAFPAAAQAGRHHVILHLGRLGPTTAHSNTHSQSAGSQIAAVDAQQQQQQQQSQQQQPSPPPQHLQLARQQDAAASAASSKAHAIWADAPLPAAPPRLALAFRFGSVVFFPSEPAADAALLQRVIHPFVVDPEPTVHEEDTLVEVRPSLSKWVERGRDKIIVRTMDMDNLSLIANALGQSAALDHYTRQAAVALEEYHAFKQGRPLAGHRGGWGSRGQDELLKMVARNRQLRVEVIGLLGILDKSEAAWRSDKYFATWQALTKEFELGSRLEVLLDKLCYLEVEVRYELETTHGRNLEMLVNIVIALLLLSVLVTIYHLCKDWTRRKQAAEHSSLQRPSLEHLADEEKVA